MAKNILETLNELNEGGSLKTLVDCGMLSTKVFFYHEVLLYYDAQKKSTNKKTTEIVSELCNKCKVTEITIYRIIKLLNIKDESHGISSAG